MTCDPRICSEARTIPVLSYEEAAELALAACLVSPPIAAQIFSWDPLSKIENALPDGVPDESRIIQARLQVREGVGTKLQFAGGACLLDAFLYPGVGGGTPHVLHVDTRSRDGRTVDQAPCIAMIETR